MSLIITRDDHATALEKLARMTRQKVLARKWFNQVVVTTILCNSFTMSLRYVGNQELLAVLDVVDVFYTLLFIWEMMTKIIGLGFFSEATELFPIDGCVARTVHTFPPVRPSSPRPSRRLISPCGVTRVTTRAVVPSQVPAQQLEPARLRHRVLVDYRAHALQIRRLQRLRHTPAAPAAPAAERLADQEHAGAWRCRKRLSFGAPCGNQSADRVL